MRTVACSLSRLKPGIEVYIHANLLTKMGLAGASHRNL